MGVFDYLYSAAKYLTLLTTTGLLGVLAMLYWNQNLLIYPSAFPQGSRTTVPTPDSAGISKWEDLYIESGDKTKLHCYLLRSPNAKYTIVYYHANAGNMGHRLPISREIMNRLNCNIFMLSYRGYGKSDGSPNELGMKLDAQAALDYVINHPELKTTKIIIYGQSIGGAAAIHTASKNQGKVEALIVENTFLSVPKLIPSVFPRFPFISYFCHQIWNSEELISGIQVPALFLSSGKDELVPQSHMRKLYESYPEKQIKVFKTFVHGTHNDIVMQPGYFDELERFVKNLKGKGRTLAE